LLVLSCYIFTLDQGPANSVAAPALGGQQQGVHQGESYQFCREWFLLRHSWQQVICADIVYVGIGIYVRVCYIELPVVTDVLNS
jgi:hypothetical protein